MCLLKNVPRQSRHDHQGTQVLIKKHKIIAGAVATNHHAAIDTKQQRISVRPLFVICVNTQSARR